MEESKKLKQELDEAHNRLVSDIKRDIGFEKILIVVILIAFVSSIMCGVRDMIEGDIGWCIFFVLLSAINGTNGYFTIKRLFKKCVTLEVSNVLQDVADSLESKMKIEL